LVLRRVPRLVVGKIPELVGNDLIWKITKIRVDRIFGRSHAAIRFAMLSTLFVTPIQVIVGFPPAGAVITAINRRAFAP
jgi:hypothetical protein